ncbi:MAG: hypothetical protein QNJ54_22340 [Prochloraceae cyanobacterium]|nr:hypothetical protein [Prochloraceae cyanobacterium]
MDIIFPKAAKNQYLFDKEKSIDPSTIQKDSTPFDITIPLTIDTEFTGMKRKGITGQVRGIFEPKGEIFAHPDLIELAKEIGKTEDDIRHPVFDSGFIGINYLKSIGVDIKLKKFYEYRDKGNKKKPLKQNGLPIPWCEFIVLSHYALAELLMMVTEEYRQDILDLIEHNWLRKIEQNKRVKTTTYHNGKPVSESIKLNWLVYINGKAFRVKLRIVDTVALHGVASYADLCETVGIDLKYKDTLTLEEKKNMHLIYFNQPEKFDNYALGDLEVYDILFNNAELFRKIYKSLDILEYYEPPKLTIGATIAQIFRCIIYKLFNISPEDKEGQKEILKLCFKGSAIYYKDIGYSTAALIAKVFGGRCRNNRPTTSFLKKLLADLDILGAYGEGQRNQIYPFGNPVVEQFDPNSKINRFYNLREWLEQRKSGKKDCELVPGLWTAIVSTKYTIQNNTKYYSNLKIEQDFLSSWFGFKIEEIRAMPTDSECFELEIKPKTGQVKIFNNQVVNGVINHDFIQWLYNICTPQQRNELLDNLYINTAVYYPAYSRVNSPQELLEKISKHKGENTTTSKKRKKVNSARVESIKEEHSYWYGINLGELLINNLLAWRKIYPKYNEDGSRNPLNTLYKLCVNTLYGIFVSPYFDIGNVIVGNNITARCRALAWYMEKGLYGVQPITDGCVFSLLELVYPLKQNRRITANNVTNLYREIYPIKRQIKLAPINNLDNIHIYWYKHFYRDKGKIKQKYEAVLKIYKDNEVTYIGHPKKWIDNVCMEHLKNIFPNVDVLHANSTRLKVEKTKDGNPLISYENRIGQFEFETKGIYTEGFFHGSANYCLISPNKPNIAARSYEKKKEHETIEEIDNEFTITKYYENINPAEKFLFSFQNPFNITRAKVFRKTGILKIKEYKKNPEKWQKLGFVPGDTIYKIGLLREFSLSQLTFLNLNQYQQIEKEVARNKRYYNQSYEGYFINNDGTLNFQDMIETIDRIIASGATSINKVLDKDRHRTRNKDINHPESRSYLHIKRDLFNLSSNDDNSLDSDFIDHQLLIDENDLVYCFEEYTQDEVNLISEGVVFEGELEDDLF